MTSERRINTLTYVSPVYSVLRCENVPFVISVVSVLDVSRRVSTAVETREMTYSRRRFLKEGMSEGHEEEVELIGSLCFHQLMMHRKAFTRLDA